MHFRQALYIIPFLAFTVTACSDASDNSFESIPGQYQRAIFTIVFSQDVGKFCTIRFNRDDVFNLYEKKLQKDGIKEPDLKRNRAAYVAFSKNYDKDPKKFPPSTQCSAEERARHAKTLGQMQAGVFPEF